MQQTHEKQPFYLRKIPFAIVSIILAGGFVFLARYLYRRAGKPTDEFVVRLGEYALEIALFVLVGAAVKQIVDWLIDERTRRFREADKRLDFLRRLRDVHVSVMYSRDLICAHGTAKTWSEQSRDLMRRVPELEEISEDLKAASSRLFDQQDQIKAGVEGIIGYLKLCRAEYIDNHRKVDSGGDASSNLLRMVKEGHLPWYADFSSGSGTYLSDYDKNLTKAKGAMRKQVYGSKG